jgi:hypothetical protein
LGVCWRHRASRSARVVSLRRDLSAGRLWTCADVYGRVWMAPRAGFEVARKFLSAHAATCVVELNTPVRTPLCSNLRASQPACCNFCSAASSDSSSAAVNAQRTGLRAWRCTPWPCAACSDRPVSGRAPGRRRSAVDRLRTMRLRCSSRSTTATIVARSMPNAVATDICATPGLLSINHNVAACFCVRSRLATAAMKSRCIASCARSSR